MQEWEPSRHFHCHGTPPQTTIAAAQSTGASSLAKAFLLEKCLHVRQAILRKSLCSWGLLEVIFTCGQHTSSTHCMGASENLQPW
ncbi:uncharacterized [Tachysurus ichikawai]